MSEKLNIPISKTPNIHQIDQLLIAKLEEKTTYTEHLQNLLIKISSAGADRMLDTLLLSNDEWKTIAMCIEIHLDSI